MNTINQDLKVTSVIIEWVVAEVHQARDLNCHFYVKSDHFGPRHCDIDDDVNDVDYEARDLNYMSKVVT